MVEYRAYAKLYENGKPIGRAFLSNTAKTKEQAEKEAEKANKIWNKKQKSRIEVRLVEVKKFGDKKTINKTIKKKNNLFDNFSFI